MPKRILKATLFNPAMLLSSPATLTLSQKILATRPTKLIQYLPFSEPFAAGNAIDLSPEGNDAIYNTVTLGVPGIGDGLTAARMNSVSGFINIYSAGLNADFDGAEGTMLIWGRVDAGVWTDGTFRTMGVFFVNATNRILIRKDNANNQIGFLRIGGGIAESVTLAGVNPTTYFMIASTWSETTDKFKAYYMDDATPFTQSGVTQVGLGAFVGNLSNTRTLVGAETGAGGSVWNGDVAHWAVWNTPLTEEELENFTT